MGWACDLLWSLGFGEKDDVSVLSRGSGGLADSVLSLEPLILQLEQG